MALVRSAGSFTRRIRFRASSRLHGLRIRAVLDHHVVGSLDVARSALPEHDVRLLVLHGCVGRGDRSWTLITMAWRSHLRRQDMITDVHFHDLGKLCFAFTAFWGYLTFGQYLVIWYGNLGEETHWARLRLIAPWSWITMTVVALMFVLPFFGLLSRAAKVYLPTMAFFAACLVVGL